MSEREDCRRCGGPFFVIGNIVPVIQKRSAGCIPVRIGKSRRQENFVYQESKSACGLDLSMR